MPGGRSIFTDRLTLLPPSGPVRIFVGTECVPSLARPAGTSSSAGDRSTDSCRRTALAILPAVSGLGSTPVLPSAPCSTCAEPACSGHRLSLTVRSPHMGVHTTGFASSFWTIRDKAAAAVSLALGCSASGSLPACMPSLISAEQDAEFMQALRMARRHLSVPQLPARWVRGQLRRKEEVPGEPWCQIYQLVFAPHTTEVLQEGVGVKRAAPGSGQRVAVRVHLLQHDWLQGSFGVGPCQEDCSISGGLQACCGHTLPVLSAADGWFFAAAMLMLLLL